MDGSSIGGGALRKIWGDIADCTDLGVLRHGFADNFPFPYESLSEEVIAQSLRAASAALLLSGDQRSELADWVIDSIVQDRLPGVLELPKEIARFAIDILAAGPGGTVYCPEPSNEMTAIAVMHMGGIPIIIGPHLPFLASIFASISGKSFQFSHRDPYALDVTKPTGPFEFELGVVSPSFGQRYGSQISALQMPSEFGARSSEALGVELALRCITQKAVVIVPNSFLFKAGPERQLREHLVESGQLEAVVGFPNGLLPYANLPISMLVIRRSRSSGIVTFCKVSETEHLSGQGKLRSHDRRFTGAAAVLRLLGKPDGLTCISISAADIRSQDYSLTPERFLDKSAAVFEERKDESVSLGDIVTILKPQLLPETKGDNGIAVQEVSPGEMPCYGYLESSPRIRYVDAKIFKTRSSQIVETDDILLSTKGTIGKVGLCKPIQGGLPLLPSLSSVIMKLKGSSPIQDPRYLVMYLRSPAVQHMLTKLAVGVTVQNISLGELRSLPVWVPPLEEQMKLIRAFERHMELERQSAAIATEQEAVAHALWQDTGLDLEDLEAA